MHPSEHCNIFTSLKMIKLHYEHCLLIGVVILWTFSLSVDGSRHQSLKCKRKCEAEGDQCQAKIYETAGSIGAGFKGIETCNNKKYECYKKCTTKSRVKRDTEFVGDQAVIFYYLCANYCKGAYNRIESICTKKCWEKLFRGKIQRESLKL